MNPPTFLNLTPRIVDPTWFNLDQPCDDEEEIIQLETEYQTFVRAVTQRDAELMPIGKIICDNMDDDDDEEDDEDNDDEESESRDDEEDEEIEMDVSYERNSPAAYE